MDVLAARNQTSVRNQLAGDWLQPRWEWSGHILPIHAILSHATVASPPCHLTSYSAVTATSSHLQLPTSPVSA